MEYLAQGGVDMHHVTELVNGGIAAHEGTDLLHNVGSMSSKGMAA